MNISEYTLKEDFRAPKINLTRGEFQTYNMFQKGELVSGYIDESTGKKLVITEDAHAIPLSVLNLVGGSHSENEGGEQNKTVDPAKKIENEAKAAVKENNKKERIEIPKEYREQMEKIKNTNIVNSIVNKSRNSVNGMIAGAAVGLIGALILRSSKFMGIVLGATAGGFIGYSISGDAKAKDKQTDNIKNTTDGKKV